MQMMEEIQSTRTERGEASVFVYHLECLRLVDWGDTIKFEKAWINAFDVECAIISYSWHRPANEREEAGSCLIEDDAGWSRRSEVRYPVWRRAADYMRNEEVEYLWIDKECIAQEDREAKAKAISEMDWLYHHGTHPFGLLTCTIKEEIELHLLAQILLGENFSLKEGNTAEAWPAIQLLSEITSDIWWNRAWIYQENYHGGNRINLLMPYERELETLKAKHSDLFGDLKGELVINSIRFSKALTNLCSVFNRSNPPEWQAEVASQITSRAGRYSALLERRSSMSPTIIADVGKRDVTNHPDRLPISANCCSYNIRLDSDKLDKKRHSLSVAILALFLLNGEIFSEVPGDTTSPPDLTVVESIQRYGFEGFNPPPFENRLLSFNKKCRFVDPQIAGDGVHTCGHLWQLCRRTIRISSKQAKEWRTVEETLWGLQKYMERYEYKKGLLNEYQIACRLKELRKQSPQIPAHKYMWKMAKTLADALKSGSTLRLGFLCNSLENPDWSPPMAVFICAKEDMDRHGPFVFTSFRPKNTSEGPGYHDVDKHVSLQVGVRDSGELPPQLSARAWMHGLWFWTEAPQPVVFPLPRILKK